MEVLFAVAGCLGAFALGLLARGREPAEPDMPPELERQWENFLSYTGWPEEGCGYED